MQTHEAEETQFGGGVELLVGEVEQAYKLVDADGDDDVDDQHHDDFFVHYCTKFI